ncbi:MAG: nicotinate-nucleotide adenylyltransferase [Thermoguttaceae bacterium]
MNYGIFGGSFDPIHIGHLILAETCREVCRLDRVVFVPTGVSPHRQGKSQYHASAAHRVAMVELAIAGNDAFIVNRYEAERQEVSYTAGTLQHFHEIFSQAELFLILGSDMLADLPNWKDPAAICNLATLVTTYRFGFSPPYFDALASFTTAERLERFRNHVVAMPQLEVSSTQIRSLIAERRSIRFLTPRAVESYIAHHKLYTESSGE